MKFSDLEPAVRDQLKHMATHYILTKEQVGQAIGEELKEGRNDVDAPDRNDTVWAHLIYVKDGLVTPSFTYGEFKDGVFYGQLMWSMDDFSHINAVIADYNKVPRYIEYPGLVWLPEYLRLEPFAPRVVTVGVALALAGQVEKELAQFKDTLIDKGMDATYYGSLLEG